jgi:hypothetical protein
MASSPAPTPLRPIEFFGRPWAGEGEWIPRRCLRWLPGPRRFHFHSFITRITEELWLVHDTTTWENGLVERRDGTATLLAGDRIRLTYDDMPGGTEIQLRPDGFTFSPYRMLVTNPILPVPVQLRVRDSCRWDPSTHELHDTIELWLIAVPLGRLTMRLRPDSAQQGMRASF